jgi:hypothetical protein
MWVEVDPNQSPMEEETKIDFISWYPCNEKEIAVPKKM